MKISVIYGLALLAHLGNTALTTSNTNANISSSIDKTDTLQFIDSLVMQWKADHPSLTDAQLTHVHETAERAKSHLLNEPMIIAAAAEAAAQKNSNATVVNPFTLRSHIASPRIIRRANVTTFGNSTLERARRIVHLAQLEAGIRNAKRLQNPRTNTYYASHSHVSRRADNASLRLNETVAAAVAIVAAAPSNATRHSDDYSKYFLSPDLAAMAGMPKNSDNVHSPSPLTKRDDGRWWMESIAHQGIVSYSNSAGYKVFRNVKDFGAIGDGSSDDTDAIQRAVADGDRCGANCGSSTIKPAIVYFPPGTYKVRQSINLYYNTQVIGDARNLPVIKAASSFVGLGVLSSDVYTGGNGGNEEWFINQNNFFRQIRNLIIDTSDATVDSIAGLHWQVAQATSVFNVHFFGSADRNHIGIFAENGSGGFMSNLVFKGMAVGMRCGNQQFTTMQLVFDGVSTAIDLLWDWGWTWKDIIISNAKVGFSVSGDYRGGSMLLIDSRLLHVGTGIHVTTPKGATDTEQFSVSIQTTVVIMVDLMVNHEPSGTNFKVPDGTTVVRTWTLGKIYDKDHHNGAFVKGSEDNDVDSSNLRDQYGWLYRRNKPQYEDKDPSFFLSARMSAKGDGVTDDTFALVIALAIAGDQRRALYIPFGSYIITETINVFQDISHPMPMVTVGRDDDSGSVEIQDLLLTVQGPTAGVVLMEWNIAQSEMGSAAMWDTHFRIGGAAGSHLQAADCPKLTGSVNSNCIAGALMLHITRPASAYLENVWAWTADHDLDSGPDQTQIDIYVARGILIESREGPVWLYGTSSEHAVLYQYHVYEAGNIVMAMIQTESPYYLPNPQAPAPFIPQLNEFYGDPTFEDCSSSNEHCAAAWGLMITGSTEIFIFGAGLYNWFQKYTQPCVDSQDCQQRVIKVERSAQVYMYNIYTIGTVEMISSAGNQPALAKDNTNTNEHPFTSVINGWFLASDGSAITKDDEDKDYNDDYDLPDLPAPCTASFASVEQLNAVYEQITNLAIVDISAPSMSDICIDQYLASIFYKDLHDAVHDYHELLGNDFHRKFEIYARMTKEHVQSQILEYMVYGKAPHWTCSQPNKKLCCGTTCPTSFASGHVDPLCLTLNCTAGGVTESTCVPPSNKVVPCPETIGLYPEAYTWTLQDPDGYYKTMDEKYGVPQDWLATTDLNVAVAYGCEWGQYNEETAAREMAKCLRDNGIFWYNYPAIKQNYTLPDPSEIVSQRINDYQKLLDYATTELDGLRGTYKSYLNIADTLSLPSMMAKASVDNMRSIAKVIDDMEEAERKSIITSFFTGLLFMIPGIGAEAAGALGLTVLRAILNVAGDLAQTAYSIYDVVHNGDGDVINGLMAMVLTNSLIPGKGVGAEMRAISTAKIGTLPERMKTDVLKARKMQFSCKKT